MAERGHGAIREPIHADDGPSSRDEPRKPRDKRQPGSAELFFLDRDATAFADDDLEFI